MGRVGVQPGPRPLGQQGNLASGTARLVRRRRAIPPAGSVQQSDRTADGRPQARPGCAGEIPGITEDADQASAGSGAEESLIGRMGKLPGTAEQQVKS